VILDDELAARSTVDQDLAQRPSRRKDTRQKRKPESQKARKPALWMLDTGHWILDAGFLMIFSRPP
jgi:hypothetical protein